MYAIVDPFTFQVFQFSSFDMSADTATRSQVDGEGVRTTETLPVICVSLAEPDQSLLGQTYDPETNTFNP